MDVRITIMDRDVHAVGLTASDNNTEQRLDIRRNDMQDVRYTPLQLSQALRMRILKFVASYDLRFAAIDMAIDHDDQWIFFEINANGQWAWLDLVGVSDIAGSFLRSFKRCSKR